jgi:DNA-binding response OmpR family regulator
VAGQDGSPAQGPVSKFSGKAAELMTYLDSKRGTPVSRQDILRNVWPELPEGDVAHRQLLDRIEELRAGIEEEPAQPVHLITIGEFGYMLL